MLRIHLYFVTNPIDMYRYGCIVAECFQSPDFFIKDFTTENDTRMLHKENKQLTLTPRHTYFPASKYDPVRLRLHYQVPTGQFPGSLCRTDTLF